MVKNLDNQGTNLPTIISRITLFKKVGSLLKSSHFIWFILLVGIVLRSAQYLYNRSIWLDEAFIALNVLDRSFLELLQPLDYNQATPYGFLLLTKLSNILFGNSEYSLRLFPFIAGILSVFLFFVVSQWWLRSYAVPIALLLFAVSGRLIYYSSELKPYAFDVFIAILIYLLVIRIRSELHNFKSVVFFGLLCAVLVWFSFPSVFVLAGTGTTLVTFCIIRKQWFNVANLVIAYISPALSFIAFYVLSLQALSSNDALQESWGGRHNAFMPLLPSSFQDFSWYVETFLGFFRDPGRFQLVGIAALLFLIGCISLFKANREKFFILLSPVLVTLLASGLQKYPFKGRLVLFLLPIALILIAEGAQRVIEWSRSRSAIVGVTVSALLVGALCFHPVYTAVKHLKTPFTPQQIKPVLSYIDQHWQDGDTLYLYYFSQYAFKYYMDRYSFDDRLMQGKPVWEKTNILPSYPPQLIVGHYFTHDPQVLIADLNQIHGKSRVWVLLSHVWDVGTVSAEGIALDELDRLGKRLDSFRENDAYAYLYDLSSR